MNGENFNSIFKNKQLKISDSTFYRGTIFNKLSTEPKNYTIAFRYEAERMIGSPQYIKVNIDGVEVTQNKFIFHLF